MADETQPNSAEPALTGTPVQPAKTGNPPKEVRASGAAIAALVLGILAISCPLLGVPAWIIGQIERGNIRKGNSSPVGWGIASAGWILGIIFTALTALAVLLFILFFSFGIIAGLEGLDSGGFDSEFF